MRRLGARDTVVIPTPLDLSDFDQSKGKIAEKKGQKWILTVARLDPIKGLDYLIRAMLFVENGTLTIVGGGKERERLEALSKSLNLNNRIIFVGTTPHSKVWDYLQEATLFVLPSISEGFPRALLEAMACGLPIVATRVGGTPELIIDNVNGLLVPARDERALAEAITLVLNDHRLQEKMRVENIKKSQNYMLPSISSQICSFLEHTLHRFSE
jgi:glycosyltransferase involved in cell wall biosynthesis